MDSSLRNKKIIIYTPKLDYKIGGVVVLHNLAKDLTEIGVDTMIFSVNGDRYENEFCNNFSTLEDIDEKTVVVYPEVIEGNPLNAKNVVRWMLCDVGVHCSKEIYKTWGENDLVFHYATFNQKYDGSDVDVLYTVWINQKIENKRLQREGSCYLFKKAMKFHKDIKFIHPKDSILIDNCSMDEIIEIFNKKKYFYCYDPYSFYDSMAALCGCIPIVYPIFGVSKLELFRTRALSYTFSGERKDVPGIAYGVEDLPHAINTLGDVWEERKDLVRFGKKTVADFIKKADTYFFGDKKNCKVVTVQYFFGKYGNSSDDNNMVNIEKMKENELLQMNDQEITNLNQKIQQKDTEIIVLNQTIQRKEQELIFVKSSKFWKLREKYVAFKNKLKTK